jgi:hypothetical protein
MGWLEFVNHWWNLPYLVALGLVGTFLALQILGLLGGSDSEFDHDHALPMDAHADPGDLAHTDHDFDADAPDADGDTDGESEPAGASALHGLLSFFGIGRVPLMAVWVPFFIFAGFCGLFVNSRLYASARGEYPTWGFAVSLALALTSGAIAARLFAKAAARLVDTGGRGATTKHELQGHSGVVASATLDNTFGEIRVRDPRGNELLLHGRLLEGEPLAPRGAKVLLVDYDSEKGLYWVTRSPEDEGWRS